MRGRLGLAAVDKVKSNVQMDVSSPDVGHDAGYHDTALGLAPTQDLAQETQRVGLYAHGHVLTLVAADFLEAGVLGPWAEGNLA